MDHFGLNITQTPQHVSNTSSPLDSFLQIIHIITYACLTVIWIQQVSILLRSFNSLNIPQRNYWKRYPIHKHLRFKCFTLTFRLARSLDVAKADSHNKSSHFVNACSPKLLGFLRPIYSPQTRERFNRSYQTFKKEILCQFNSYWVLQGVYNTGERIRSQIGICFTLI